MKVPFEKFIMLKKNLKGVTQVKVLSGSMTPFIYKGDIVEVTTLGVESVIPGDVIVFWRENKLICHLLMKKRTENGKTYLRTKGLSSGEYDDEIEEDLFLGVVTKPRIGTFRRIFFKLLIIFERNK
jgi:signal peptidase I